MILQRQNYLSLMLGCLLMLSPWVYGEQNEDNAARYQRAEALYEQESFKQAREILVDIAKKGYAPAQNRLGIIYRNGIGVSTNYKAAVRWFHQAASQNYAPAQKNLGQMYEQGLGVDRDLGKAYRLYRAAESQSAE